MKKSVFLNNLLTAQFNQKTSSKIQTKSSISHSLIKDLKKSNNIFRITPKTEESKTSNKIFDANKIFDKKMIFQKVRKRNALKSKYTYQHIILNDLYSEEKQISKVEPSKNIFKNKYILQQIQKDQEIRYFRQKILPLYIYSKKKLSSKQRIQQFRGKIKSKNLTIPLSHS